MTTLRTVIARLALMAAATSVALLAGEMIFRAFTDVDPRFYNAASTQVILSASTDNPTDNPFDLPVAMRTTRAGAVGHNAGFAAHINRHGMRDRRDYAFQKPTGTTRVMLVGDSVMFGHTAEKDLIPAKVREALQSSLGRRVEVPSLSCPAWAFANEMVVLKQAVSRFEVDALVVLLVLNDLTGRPALWASDGTPDHQTPLGSADRSIEGRFELLRAMIRHSSLLTALAWSLKGVYAKSQPMDSSLQMMLQGESKVAETVAYIEPSMRWMVKWCRDKGIKCTVAIAPYATQYSEAIGKRVLEQWFGKPYNRNLLARWPQREVLKICGKVGMDCLDLFETFRRQRDVASLYFETPEGRFDYVHLSASGNKVVGDALAAHVLRRLRAAPLSGSATAVER